jgi:hypothetical protein
LNLFTAKEETELLDTLEQTLQPQQPQQQPQQPQPSRKKTKALYRLLLIVALSSSHQEVKHCYGT